MICTSRVPIGVHEAALGRKNRRAGPRRHRAAACAPRHADRAAVSHSRARCAVAAQRRARRSGRRSEDRASAGCSTSAPRSCCASSGRSMRWSGREGARRLSGVSELRPWPSMKKTGKAYYMISAVAQKYQHPPADAAPVRARGTAEAIAHRRQHAAVLGRRSRAARDDSDADARSRRESCRCRSHSQHAPQDPADAGRSQRVHGVRQARARPRHRRLGAAAQHGAREVDVHRSRARQSSSKTEPVISAKESRRAKKRSADLQSASIMMRASAGAEQIACVRSATEPVGSLSRMVTSSA